MAKLIDNFYSQAKLDEMVKSYKENGEFHLLLDFPSRYLRVPPKLLPEGSGPRLGRGLLEVFSVQFDNRKKCAIEIYGEIIVGTPSFFRFIYNRSKEEPEEIWPGRCQSLLLNGPAVSYASEEDGFYIFVKLMDKKTGRVVSDGWIFHDRGHHEPTTKGVTTLLNRRGCKFYVDENVLRSGKLTVEYVHYKYAIMAVVEVTLKEDHEPCTVHGTITASSNLYLYPDRKSVLFKKTLLEGWGLTISPGNIFPLSRSVVAVPVVGKQIANGELNVHVDLRGKDDAKIAVAKAVFPSRNSGTDEEEVGAIRVKVTWKINYRNNVEGLEDKPIREEVGAIDVKP